jgi:hypothetical protein
MTEPLLESINELKMGSSPPEKLSSKTNSKKGASECSN